MKKIIIITGLIIFTSIQGLYSQDTVSELNESENTEAQVQEKAKESPAEKMRIAIVDLKANGVSDVTAGTVSNMLRSELIKMGRFIVVERGQMDAILQEQGLQQTGCTDSACAVELGKMLSARKILVGEISPMGQSLVITVRIVDVEKGVSEFAGSQKAPSENDLDKAVQLAANELAYQMEGGKYIPPTAEGGKKEPAGLGEAFMNTIAPDTITPTAYYLRAIVPGWGQCYAGDSMKGWIYGGVFAGAAIFSIYAYTSYLDKKDTYDSMKSGSESKFKSAYDDYESAATLGNVSLYILAAAYLANWVDIIFFTKPEYGKKVALGAPETVGENTTFFSLNFTAPYYGRPEKGMNASCGYRF